MVSLFFLDLFIIIDFARHKVDVSLFLKLQESMWPVGEIVVLKILLIFSGYLEKKSTFFIELFNRIFYLITYCVCLALISLHQRNQNTSLAT